MSLGGFMDWLSRLKDISPKGESHDLDDDYEYHQCRRLMDKGLDFQESIAFLKKISARTFDDRKHCLECKNLKGVRDFFKCSNIVASRLGLSEMHSGISNDLATMPQRCKGFINED